MNQNIIAYLKENKDKYSKESLVEQLEKSGYPEEEIQQGLSLVYDGTENYNLKTNKSNNFWDFKTHKIYTKASEKWLDFLFGLILMPIMLNVFAFLVFILIKVFFNISSLRIFFLAFVIAIIAMVIYLIFERRKYILIGIISFFVLFATVIIMLIYFMISSLGNLPG